MKKKSFSGFFWILVVLAAIFLFFFMRRNVEGFFTNCRGNPLDVSKCNPCYKPDGTKVTSLCSPPPYCKCPNGSSTTKPARAPAVKTCPSGQRLVNGSCQAINWSN